MKFFVPHIESPEEAEKIYQAIKKKAPASWVVGGKPIDDRRIRSITFRDKRKTVTATVGGRDPLEGNIVMAILQTATEVRSYLIYTETRGVGDPMAVEEHEVIGTESFD